MCKKKNNINDVKEWLIKHGNGAEVLDEVYLNSKSKMLFKCKCGNVFSRSFEKMKSRNSVTCLECSKHKLWSIEDIRNYVEAGGVFELITNEYISHKQKIKIICKTCGKIHTTSFDSYRQTIGVCRNCNTYPIDYNGKKHNMPQWNYENTKKYIAELGMSLITTEAEFNSSKIKIKCSNGHEFEKSIYSLLKSSKTGCNKCDGVVQKLSYNDVFKYVKNKGCELISKDYIEAHLPLEFRCSCGNTFIDTFHHFKWRDKTRCSKCSSTISTGEHKIISYLNNKKITYEYQKKFNDCTYISYLPFDFYIDSFNVCIEYDGEHHFMPIQLYGGDDFLKIQKIRDDIKTKYCIDKNIRLIRIPYYDMKNIENILSLELGL